MRTSKLKYQAIIFDLDGTLADTIIDLANATNWALRQLGFPEHSVEEYKLMVGEGRLELCKRALPENHNHLAEKLADLMTQHYSQHYLDNTVLYPGIKDLLHKLSSDGIKLAVLSNKPDEFVKLTVNHLCDGIHFDAIYGQREGIKRKPAPDGALLIAEQFGITPNNFLYVGDTSIDMQTANSAGMFALGVSWGFRSRDELIQSGASVIIDNPIELYKIISS